MLDVLAGLCPHQEDEDSSKNVNTSSQNVKSGVMPTTAAIKKKARISFEDYHSTWLGIATSKSDTEIANPCEYTQILI